MPGPIPIVDASHVVVFANKTSFSEELVDSYVRNVRDTRGTTMEKLQGYGAFMKSKLLPLTAEEKAQWTSKQTHIALGNLFVGGCRWLSV